ncbi:MAG: S49 family peptidase, partial [Bacteroidota bacterium]
MDQILELLSSRWLIHTDTALSYIPLLVAFLSGKDEKLSLFKPTDEDKRRATPKALAIGQLNTVTEFEFSDPDIPANSVAVIPVWGPVVPSKSMQLIDSIRLAENNPNINSILFPVNSPGGTIFYLDILSEEIKTTSKPTVAVIMNCCASAAMWITSAMDYRIATSPMDQVGSIGTMVSVMDFRGLLEKIGIKEMQLYADKSILKNASVRS